MLKRRSPHPPYVAVTSVATRHQLAGTILSRGEELRPWPPPQAKACDYGELRTAGGGHPVWRDRVPSPRPGRRSGQASPLPPNALLSAIRLAGSRLPARIASARGGKGGRFAKRFATEHDDPWTRKSTKARNTTRHAAERYACKGNLRHLRSDSRGRGRACG